MWWAVLCGLRAVPVCRLSPVVPSPAQQGIMLQPYRSAHVLLPTRNTHRHAERSVLLPSHQSKPTVHLQPALSPISCSVALPTSRAPASCSACTAAMLAVGVRLQAGQQHGRFRIAAVGLLAMQCACYAPALQPSPPSVTKHDTTRTPRHPPVRHEAGPRSGGVGQRIHAVLHCTGGHHTQEAHVQLGH